MNKHEFRQLFNEKILILDGATGTNLMNAGMPLGVCPEKYILEHKKVMLELNVVSECRHRYLICSDIYL